MKNLFKLSFVFLTVTSLKADGGQVSSNVSMNCDNFQCQDYCTDSASRAFDNYCKDFRGIQKDWCYGKQQALNDGKYVSYAQACANACPCAHNPTSKARP